jgi:hypothetical protein
MESPSTPEEIRAFEQQCRDGLERAFRDHNSQHSGDPVWRIDVDDVKLEGTYPDTAVVVEGKDRDGRLFADRLAVWGPSSAFSRTPYGLDSNIGDILIDYLEAGTGGGAS